MNCKVGKVWQLNLVPTSSWTCFDCYHFEVRDQTPECTVDPECVRHGTQPMVWKKEIVNES